MAQEVIPKQRLVIYADQTVCDKIAEEAKRQKRSISSIAYEMFLAGMNSIPENETPAAAQPAHEARHTEPEIKDIVYSAITDMPDETLQALAEKLQTMLKPHESEKNTTTHTNGTASTISTDTEYNKVLAIRLQRFMKESGLTQRSIKQVHGIDVTQMSRWINGSRGIAEDTLQKILKILPADPTHPV